MHGLDLGGRRNVSAGKTVLTTLAIHEDGTRQPVRIVGGRLTGPQIRDLITSTFAQFGGAFMVENNATQQWIIEFTLLEDQLAIVPFTTGANKANIDYGVDSLALEFSTSSWAIPCARKPGTTDEFLTNDEVGAWLDGLQDHDANSHTSDTTMASWFAREGARRFFSRGRGKRAGGGVGVRVLGGGRRRA